MSGSAKPKAVVIDIMIEYDPSGIFIATSPDLKGLVVAAHTQPELKRRVPEAIKAMYLACETVVTVHEVEKSERYSDVSRWAAVPNCEPNSSLSA